MLFGSAFLGYYLGSEIFELKTEYCLALSGIIVFITLVLESFLFIIKEEKLEMNNRRKKAADK